jgi:putative resolvase
VVYARVSAHDQRDDLDRQVGRVMAWAGGQQLAVDQVVSEVAPGWAGVGRSLRGCWPTRRSP